MSKGLLHRRRMMQLAGGGADWDAYGYYKYNKLLHLDGIDNGGDPLTWKDVVNGYVFSTESGTNTYNNTDGYLINGLMRMQNQAFVNDYVSKVLNAGVTIECVCGAITKANTFLFKVGFTGTTNCFRGLITNTRNGVIRIGGIMYGRTLASAPYDRTKKTTISVTKQGSGYIGNAVINFATTTDFEAATTQTYGYDDSMIIGAPNSSYTPDTIIHSIRIYEGLLDNDIILHNQQVDNIRFNLGL